MTFLADTRILRGIDVHCRTKWPNGTTVGLQVACVRKGGLLIVTAVKGYDDMSFRENVGAEGVLPLIKHRVFAQYDTPTTRE